jgi:hypothetical protein
VFLTEFLASTCLDFLVHAPAVWFSGRQLASKNSFFPLCAARACRFGFSFCSCSLIQRRLSAVNHVSLVPVSLLMFSLFMLNYFSRKLQFFDLVSSHS